MTAFRCGYVGIFGRPNVGKSTFLNQVLGEKIAIVTAKAQTTRNRIVGIKNRDHEQLILVDTPGIHRPRGSLNEALMDCTMAVLRDVDVSLFLFGADQKLLSPGEKDLLDILVREQRSFVPVLNKADLVDCPVAELPLQRQLEEFLPGHEGVVRPISALTGEGIEPLVEDLCRFLPESPPLFPRDANTEISERFWVQEVVREKIFQLTRHEVPYSTATLIDYFHDRETRLSIGVTIFVEHPSQKGIIIGRRGRMLKAIGTAARKEIEALVGIPVFLELWVSVEKNWTKNPAALERFGYRLNQN
jgi:GTP-binding protein Era